MTKITFILTLRVDVLILSLLINLTKNYEVEKYG